MTSAGVLDPVALDRLRQLTVPGEPDVLNEVLKVFLQEVPPRIVRLRIAQAAGNIEEVQRAAHSLKGSAGNIGASQMFDVCKQLDVVARSGNLQSSGPLVDALLVEFGKVEAEIHRLIGDLKE
jgi:HPt (histidine-containing phosphotransfer) domain-containing protein